jgi:hypothetical protein
MAFPDIHNYAVSSPGPYEKQMGGIIASLLRAFKGLVPDPESNAVVLALAEAPDRWSAGHKVFDEIRRRLLRTSDKLQYNQYFFEEACCQALYNATSPIDEFDSCSPFFVAPSAIGLAHQLNNLPTVLSILIGKS